MKFSAFISYNHADRDWAVWLHRGLERYVVPKHLRGRPAPWGELGPRLPPVFRDRDELATSTDLAASVKEALAQSATLVVICSPNSARSKWVNEEIRAFIGSGRAHLIRLIIVDGEPHAKDPERECLPPALLRDGAPEPLAADVRKEADGKQGARLKVLAGILGVSYDELRQREAARRQKRLAAIAAAASVGFVVMAALTLLALISRAEAVEQRQLAERRQMTAERTVDFVKGMFLVADPLEARGESITAREIVDRATERLDSDALAREPGVKAELAVTLADVYGALGLYRKSDALVRRTFQIRHGQQATFARQLNALGESYARLGEDEAAAQSFRAAWKQAGDAPPALRSRILVGLGQSLSNLGRTADARRVLNGALQIDQSRGEEAGGDAAFTLEAVGLSYFQEGDLERAQPLIERALVIRRRFEGPNSPAVSDNLNTLGNIAYMRHDLKAAERYYRGNIAVDAKVLGPTHPDVATTMNNLGRVLIEQRRFREATPFLERAKAVAEREVSGRADYMAFLYSNLALARRYTGRSRDAEALFAQAIELARQDKHRTLGPSLAELADLRCRSGRTAEGLKLLDEAATATRRDYPDTPWRWAWVENIRGECLLRGGASNAGAKAIAASSAVISKEWPGQTFFGAEARRRARLARAR